MTETTETPDIYYGAMEGGHVVSVKSFENIGVHDALVLAEKESGLTGWKFRTQGIMNSRGQYVWIMVRSDESSDSDSPTRRESHAGPDRPATDRARSHPVLTTTTKENHESIWTCTHRA
jgi:hypothetical protein